MSLMRGVLELSSNISRNYVKYAYKYVQYVNYTFSVIKVTVFNSRSTNMLQIPPSNISNTT